MDCLNIELFSMHLDHELDAQVQQQVAEHLATCQRCSGRLRVLQEHEVLHRRAHAGSRSVHAQESACYSAEELSAYVNGTLTPREAEPFEQHLRTCDACLREVMAVRRTLSLLQRGPMLTPPPSLVATVRRTFGRGAQQGTVERLGALIIEVARGGMKFVEAALLPAHVGLTVGGQLLPTGAFRGTGDDAEALAVIDIQQSVGDLELRISVLHEGADMVLLRIQLWKQGKPLARRRVSLASNGHVRHSSNTSSRGEVEFPRLVPGNYTLRIPQEKVETQIMLRSPSESVSGK